jgi:hypothetical protein
VKCLSAADERELLIAQAQRLGHIYPHLQWGLEDARDQSLSARFRTASQHRCLRYAFGGCYRVMAGYQLIVVSHKFATQ